MNSFLILGVQAVSIFFLLDGVATPVADLSQMKESEIEEMVELAEILQNLDLLENFDEAETLQEKEDLP